MRIITRACLMSSNSDNFLVLDNFVLRQFDSKTEGVPARITMDTQEFQDKLNAFVEEQGRDNVLVDGYAPFCKHIFIENFAGIKQDYVELNEQTEPLIKTDYIARTEKELPVLVRWVEEDDVKDMIPEAKWLDIILYSREQIILENKAMGEEPETEESAPWGVISVKAQSVNHELPMNPITMMRNALGVEEGGSGVSLTREKYVESVDFWKSNLQIMKFK
eukprot:TRINITY_DN26834_c0_g1_i1.p1 TRINITY_DN26834_c0_g1~~TRINITY_DN26834_c0_g1_i1.p1  ORF type:complete len:220 (+),score=76.24 TRINITY_DN26834_c0_g1_i1:19-678(+)